MAISAHELFVVFLTLLTDPANCTLMQAQNFSSEAPNTTEPELTTVPAKGQPTLNVARNGECFINEFNATVQLNMTNVNVDQWPVKLLVEEKQGKSYTFFCRVTYANGKCVTKDTPCTCSGTDEFLYHFTVVTPVKQNVTTYRAIVFDAKEKTSVEQTFEAPGKRKRTATLDQMKDLMKAPTWTLSMIERSRHNITLCQENMFYRSTSLTMNDEPQPRAIEQTKPCLVYLFQPRVKFQKISLDFHDRCEPDVTIILFVTGLDPDNFTIPNCDHCHKPPLVDWFVVAKWIMPTSILSFVSILLIIYYLQAPPQEFQRLVERSITSIKSMTKSRNSGKSSKKSKENSKSKSGQSIPKSINTSEKIEEEETGPKEPIIVYSYMGSEIV